MAILPEEQPRDVPRALTPPPNGRADLRLVPPAPDDAESWKRLMNVLFVHEEDELFVWARGVRAALEASA